MIDPAEIWPDEGEYAWGCWGNVKPPAPLIVHSAPEDDGSWEEGDFTDNAIFWLQPN